MDVGFCILGDADLGDGCTPIAVEPPVVILEGNCRMYPPVGLGPLKASFDYSDVEEEVKQIFMDVFVDFMRANERELNVFGAPHLGSFELIERFVKEDGLSMIRKEDEAAMRYLFRAWKARNPKRGLHFLRTYLQLLWPNGWSVEQMWQDKSLPYPTSLMPGSASPSEATHYLTSRVVVSVEDSDETGANLLQIGPALRSTLGAKFVLFMTLLRRLANTGDGGLFLFNTMVGDMTAFWAGELLGPAYTNGMVTFNGLSTGAHLEAAGESIMGGPYPPVGADTTGYGLNYGNDYSGT